MLQTLKSPGLRFAGSHRRIQAYRDIRAILGAGGVAYAILPIGDTDHENAARTTFTTVGGGALDGLVFTYSEARTSFDSPTKYRHNQIAQPDVPWNGSDEEADTPDADAWSRNDANNEAWSVGAWVNVTDTADTRIILAKQDDTTGSLLREWTLAILGDDTLILVATDESVDVQAIRISDAAITQGVMQFFVATYDGSGGASAADGMTLYANGAVLPSTATNNGSYVAMENLSVLPTIATNITAGGGVGNFFNGRMLGGALGPFRTNQELNLSQVQRLTSIGLAAQR